MSASFGVIADTVKYCFVATPTESTLRQTYLDLPTSLEMAALQCCFAVIATKNALRQSTLTMPAGFAKIAPGSGKKACGGERLNH